ncbi:MAG TPA: polysaccharide deacetylase family protein [Flavobacterium sp.]|jgi:peptidoglycan/xylan/chitin deacetylase (PgdA/CDA1 family)
MGIIKDSLYLLSGKPLLRFFKSQPVFPYYHIVRNHAVPHIKNLYEYKNIDRFNEDLDFLMANYSPINPLSLFEGNIPDNGFLLTFDDGLAEVYSVIFPILKQRGLSAIVFVNPNFVDNQKSLYKHDISLIIENLQKNPDLGLMKKVADILAVDYTSRRDLFTKLKNTKYSDRHKIKEILAFIGISIDSFLEKEQPYITKAQIHEMIREGFYFGGHTMSHPPLRQLSFEEQKAEIIESVQWVKDHFGLKYSAFAFPFSDKKMPRVLFDTMFEYDPKMLVFGNSGIKKDIDRRIIQRFSLENPAKKSSRVIVAENLYKQFNKFTGQYQIKRK